MFLNIFFAGLWILVISGKWERITCSSCSTQWFFSPFCHEKNFIQKLKIFSSDFGICYLQSIWQKDFPPRFVYITWYIYCTYLEYNFNNNFLMNSTAQRRPDWRDVFYKFCYFLNFQPVPKERLERARQNLRHFVEMYHKTLGDSCMTSKVHCMIHILDDCEYHQCHLEALSAYPFENFQSIWAGMLRSGYLPLVQIRYSMYICIICLFVFYSENISKFI